MIGLARAGWLLSAACFATILSSILYVGHVGRVAELLLVLLIVIAAVRPDAGLMLLAAAAPVVWYLASQVTNSNVAWAEAIACATLVGLSVSALRARPPQARVPLAVSVPAILFGAVVIASMIASLGVSALRLGPGFTDALVTQLTREYFIDVRGFPALHTGLLLLEGVLLCGVSARIAADPRRFRRLAAAVVVGAALAGLLNVWDLLVRAAPRSGAFLANVVELAATLRWNAHYRDFNAAGSYFAMAVLLSIAVAMVARRRVAAVAGTAVIVVALWLTGSRAGSIAGVAALASAVLLGRFAGSGRRRILTALAVVIAALGLVAALATMLPQRGNQSSPTAAADIRLEMAKVAGRMIASRPITGLGLGEFYQRSGDFITLELYLKFPAVLHENAHNNFLQVTAELGLGGGVFFVWLVGAALFLVARRAAVTRAPFDLLTFAALAAFVISWLAGHPLLVPEASYVFWMLLGGAAGAAAPATSPPRQRYIIAIAVGAILVAATLPWRMQAMAGDANLEHMGIHVSGWQQSPDGTRYRAAQGHATLFIPTGTVSTLRINPRTDRIVRAELSLDGRIADVVSLAPGIWNHVAIPARNRRVDARYVPLKLRVVDDDKLEIWITKVEPR